MTRITFWMLLALVVGAFAGIITYAFSRLHSSNYDEAAEGGKKGGDIVKSPMGQTMLLVSVILILALLVVWLIHALMRRGLL